MKIFPLILLLVSGGVLPVCLAEDITTLDGVKYENVRDVSAKHKGLYFVTGTEGSSRA